MKYWVIILLTLLLGCKKEMKESNVKELELFKEVSKSIKKLKFNLYDTIMNQYLENIDTVKEYIQYKIIRDKKVFNQDLEKMFIDDFLNKQEKNELKKKILFSSLDTVLSKSLHQKIIKLSSHNKNKIRKLYTFSLPYAIGKDKVILFLSISFGKSDSNSKITLGKTSGSEWVLIAERINGKWKIIKKGTCVFLILQKKIKNYGNKSGKYFFILTRGYYFA